MSIDHYLAQSYRKDVLGHHVEVVPPKRTEEMIKDAKVRLAKIDGLRLGASLANRDYVSYQNRRALARLLAQWEEQEVRDATPVRPGIVQAQRQDTDGGSR